VEWWSLAGWRAVTEIPVASAARLWQLSGDDGNCADQEGFEPQRNQVRGASTPRDCPQDFCLEEIGHPFSRLDQDVHGKGSFETAVSLMVSRSLVLGFHGCDQSLAYAVASGNQELGLSQNAYDWLGHGIYFWEDSPARALRWAQDESRRRSGKVRAPALLGAVIDLGNCLNLIDVEALALVKAAYEAYREICRVSGTQEARNRGPDLRARYLDCAVIETLHKLRAENNLPAFDTVRGFFVEGTELYPGAGLRELDHIQICVRSPRQVTGYFLPRNL